MVKSGWVNAIRPAGSLEAGTLGSASLVSGTFGSRVSAIFYLLCHKTKLPADAVGPRLAFARRDCAAIIRTVLMLLRTLAWLACVAYATIPIFWLAIHPRADFW